MKAARPQHASLLDFVQVDDFSELGVFDDALSGGIDAVIHVASVRIRTPLDQDRPVNHISSIFFLTPLLAIHIQHYKQ